MSLKLIARLCKRGFDPLHIGNINKHINISHLTHIPGRVQRPDTPPLEEHMPETGDVEQSLYLLLCRLLMCALIDHQVVVPLKLP